VIRVYEAAGNVIETHEQLAMFKSFESVPETPRPRIRLLMRQVLPLGQCNLQNT